MTEQSLTTDVQFNLGLVQEAVSAVVPDRDYLVWRDWHFTYRQLTERSRRLAVLSARPRPRRTHRTPGTPRPRIRDHIALYMRNCNEFIESMLGAFKSRTVPVNVNYRYVAGGAGSRRASR